MRAMRHAYAKAESKERALNKRLKLAGLQR